MKIRVKFSHLDIDSIINAGGSDSGKSLMSKLRSAAAKGTLKYAPSVAESVIEKKIRDFISENDLGIEIDTTVLLKKEQTGEIYGIAASVSAINYVMLFRALKPYIEQKLSESETPEIITKIISVIGDDCDSVISSVAKTVSDEKKAVIAGLLVEKYNKEICQAVNDAAKENNIGLSVSKINIKA